MGGVRVVTRNGQPWISVPKLDKLPEPTNLAALKAEVQRRWGHDGPACQASQGHLTSTNDLVLVSHRHCPQPNPVLVPTFGATPMLRADQHDDLGA